MLVFGRRMRIFDALRQSLIQETVMQSGPVGTFPKRCAYCHEPFCFTNNRVQALPVGNQFVCNEFCAQSLREEAHLAVKHAS
jgi:hypothetical protein